MVLCLRTRSADGLHAIHRRLTAHAVGKMYTSRTCSIWWCHLVLLTIHFWLVGPLRLEYSLLHAIWRSMSLAVGRGTHIWLHLGLWYATTHSRLWRIEMSNSLGSSIGVLSVLQALMVNLLRPARLCLRALWVRHVRSRAIESVGSRMRLLVRHLAVTLHLSLL